MSNLICHKQTKWVAVSIARRLTWSSRVEMGETLETGEWRVKSGRQLTWGNCLAKNKIQLEKCESCLCTKHTKCRCCRSECHTHIHTQLNHTHTYTHTHSVCRNVSHNINKNETKYGENFAFSMLSMDRIELEREREEERERIAAVNRCKSKAHVVMQQMVEKLILIS